MKLYVKIYKYRDTDLFYFFEGASRCGYRNATLIRQILYDVVREKRTVIPKCLMTSNPPLATDKKEIDVQMEFGANDPIAKRLLEVLDFRRSEFVKNIIRYQLGFQLVRFYDRQRKIWRRTDIPQDEKSASPVPLPGTKIHWKRVSEFGDYEDEDRFIQTEIQTENKKTGVSDEPVAIPEATVNKDAKEETETETGNKTVQKETKENRQSVPEGSGTDKEDIPTEQDTGDEDPGDLFASILGSMQ